MSSSFGGNGGHRGDGDAGEGLGGNGLGGSGGRDGGGGYDGLKHPLDLPQRMHSGWVHVYLLHQVAH